MFLKKNIKKFLLLSVFCSLLITTTVHAGSNFSFYPLKINVKKGQVFNVQVAINPNGVKNYTVKASIDFPANLIQLQSWKFNGDWMPVRKDGYDFFDNTKGILIRTAGYANGFDSTITFGVATFVAKEDGVGTISFLGDNLALDQDGNNTYASGASIPITVIAEKVEVAHPKETSKVTTSIKHQDNVINTVPESVDPPVGEMAPQGPLDIKLSLDNADLDKASELRALIKFTGTNTSTTSVALNFKIWDDNGVEMFNYNDGVDVNTVGTYDHEFSDLNLRPGAYLLSVMASYNNTIQELRQSFIIKGSPVVAKAYLPRWTCVLIVVMCLSLVYVFWRYSRKSKSYIFGSKRKK